MQREHPDRSKKISIPLNQIRRITITGRGLVTYLQQFNLNLGKMKEDVLRGEYFLDCGSGLARFASEFTDELLKEGHDMRQIKGGIVSLDSAYESEPQLREREDLKSAASKSVCIGGNISDLAFFKDDFFEDTFFSYVLNTHSSKLGKEIHFRALDEAIRVTKNRVLIYPLESLYPETPHASPDGPVLHEIKLLDGLSELKRVRMAKKISHFADLTFNHFNEFNSPVRPEIYKITNPALIQSYEHQRVLHYGMILRKKQRR